MQLLLGGEVLELSGSERVREARGRREEKKPTVANLFFHLFY